MVTFSPLITCSKGKAKVGKSVWDDPTTALKRAHNIVTDNELKVRAVLQELRASLRWMTKHHSHVADFVNLDFKAIDIEILADKANEKEGETIAEATKVVKGEGVATGGANDEAQTEAGRVKEFVSAP
nr:hypothetical protein CFP56_49227 [Quercus suber]